MAVFKRRWFMWDFARQRRFDREEFIMVATKLSELGFNGIGLYLEGAFELKSIGEGILREGVMTRDDAVWAKEKCAALGITLFPMTNVVGHMEHFLRQERFAHLCADDDLYALNFTGPEAEEFAMKILSEYIEAFDTNYIHVGGDEVPLTDKTRPLYAEFLSGICNKLLARGITPAIWNDMLWSHKELCDTFSRDVEIFDWFYNGHRPESIKFFRELGFKKVIPCPCDNSWQGFIGHQAMRPWVEEEDHTPVAPDEVEALFADAIREGDPENLMGLHTHWEDTEGRDLWGQWSAFARSGYFMQGKFDNKPCNDETLEMAIFGRVTPYTQIMHIIQDEIQTLFIHPCHGLIFRDFLFNKQRYSKILKDTARDKPEIAKETVEPVKKIEKLLNDWTAEGEFEKRCHAYLVSIVALIKASFGLYDAFAAYGKLYKIAANKQFDNTQEAKALVLEFADGFSAAAQLIKEYVPKLKAFIELTPTHTQTDFVKLGNTINYTENMAKILTELATQPSFEKIPLPAISLVIDKALNNTVIER